MRTGERSELPTLDEPARQSDDRELVISHLQKLLLEREKNAQILQSQLNSITRSAGWIVFQKFWDVYERLRLRAFYSKVTSRLSTLNKYYARPNGDHFTIKGVDEGPSIKSDGPESVACAESLATAKALLDRSRAALKELKGADVRAVAFYLPQFHPPPVARFPQPASTNEGDCELR